MMDGAKEVPCAISTSAMNDLEQVARTKPDQREEQFLRLRFEGTPAGIILRSIDFSN
jgi:hypothetical protein